MDHSETRDTEVQIREILDYYGGREDRASQETVVEILKWLCPGCTPKILIF